MNFIVNGVAHTIDASTRTLLAVLRDDFGLVGAREGCGIGVCGACTVLLDGKPISSCDMLAAQAVGREIVTIEGLTVGAGLVPAQHGQPQELPLQVPAQLHRVQQAFIEHAAFQCAYCTSGFILSTIALLNENPSPSDEEIREYLAGNLCRCGSYVNILKAVRALRK